MDCPKVEKMVDIVKGELSFAVIKGLTKGRMKNTSKTLYLFIDDELTYQNYYYDFGPLNLSCLFKYCVKVNKYLRHANKQKKVIHYTGTNPQKKVNSAFLIGAYSIIFLKYDADDVCKMLYNCGPFMGYLDASLRPSSYTVNVFDCFYAISKALRYNFFQFNDFDDKEYDLRNSIYGGDLNWLVPWKFLAFVGPTETESTSHRPEFYIKYFLKNDIKTVIRLNPKMYKSLTFTRNGIEHHDLIFPDGTAPPRDILLRFLEIVESAPGAVAVHCKAGLGRTGSLIGSYIIKHYRMSARETIAWLRICRPGSVIGPQQIWLESMEKWLLKIGNQDRFRLHGSINALPHHEYGIYSRRWPEQREKLIQAERTKKCRKSRIKPSSESLYLKKPTKSSFEELTRLISMVYSEKPRKKEFNTTCSVCLPATHSQKIIFERPVKSANGRTEKKESTISNKTTITSKTQGDRLNAIKVERLTNNSSNIKKKNSENKAALKVNKIFEKLKSAAKSKN